MNVPRTKTFPLANLALGGRLAELLTAWRTAGLSHASIARKMQSEYGLEVNPELVRSWCREAGLETGRLPRTAVA